MFTIVSLFTLLVGLSYKPRPVIFLLGENKLRLVLSYHLFWNGGSTHLHRFKVGPKSTWLDSAKYGFLPNQLEIEKLL